MKATSGSKIKNKEKFPLLIRVKMGFGFTSLIWCILSCPLKKGGHFCIDLKGMKLGCKPHEKLQDRRAGDAHTSTPTQSNTTWAMTPKLPI